MNVWISHSKDASELATRLRDALAAAGYDVHAGLEDISPGESIATRLVDTIRGVDIVIVLISHHTADSEWVPLEIGMATQEQKRIVPVLAHRNAKVPVLLRELHYLDLSDPTQFRSGVEKLAAVLHSRADEVPLGGGRADVLEGERSALETSKQVYERDLRRRWTWLANALSSSTRTSLLFILLFAVVITIRGIEADRFYVFATGIAVNLLASLLNDLITFKRGKP